MRIRSTIRKRAAEEGVALLISIFILLLISVVAIALIVSSGTESALAGNYRASTGVYYAAMAGLEEARSRLLGKGPFAFKTTNSSNFLPAAGTPLAVGTTYYLINPVSGETVAPWDPSNVYYDQQFGQEFGPTFPNPTTNYRALSLWNRTDLTPNPNPSPSYPGPLYKWVRINAVSEKSMNVVADSDTSPSDGISALFYTGTGFTKSSSGGPQVIELTASAILPNGSQKILQYVVTQTPTYLPPFLAALTLSDSTGNSATFSVPANGGAYVMKGNDYDCSGNPMPAPPTHAAIGVMVDSDVTPVTNGIPSSTRTYYTGSGTPADVESISTTNTTGSIFPASMQTPSQLNAVVQSIQNVADVTLSGNINASALHTATTAAGMSVSNPITIVINGNLDVGNWGANGYGQGYGLLLVTGTLTYDPDTTWNGIILVIGQGAVTNFYNGGSGVFNGAVFVAKTRNSSGTLLPDPNLGGASVQFGSSMQGNGIRYSSCWIQSATPAGGYKVLSFHEIAQQ